MSDTPLTNQHRSRLRTVAESTAFEEELERRLNACVDALVSIEEYWNRDNNKRALQDACEHAIATAQEALANAKKPL